MNEWTFQVDEMGRETMVAVVAPSEPFLSTVTQPLSPTPSLPRPCFSPVTGQGEPCCLPSGWL